MHGRHEGKGEHGGIKQLFDISPHPQITNFSNYFSGDPYVGLRADEMSAKNNRIADLEKEVEQLKGKLARAEGRSSRR